MNTTKNFKIMILILCFVFLFTGCGGGNDSSIDDTAIDQGYFLDSVVEGLSYVSDENFGTTDSQGIFIFQAGSTVLFSIGDIIIGETLAKSTITPVDLVKGATDESNPTVNAISRFLQTLDDDADPSNGITINENVRNLAEDKFINFEQSIVAFENDQNVQILVSELTAHTNAGIRTLISSNEAQGHLRDTLLKHAKDNLVGTWWWKYSGCPAPADPSIGCEYSKWIFKEDDTYEWSWSFYIQVDYFPYFYSSDLSSKGKYSINGNILFAEGMSDKITYEDTITLTFNYNENEFSFIGDRDKLWIYTKEK